MSEYAREEFCVQIADFQILILRMHNGIIDISELYLYPYCDKNTLFENIYRQSIENNTYFLIIGIEFFSEAEQDTGSLTFI